MSDALSLRRRQPLVLADLVPGALLRDVVLVVAAAGFVGALAQISIHLSWTPVPITGQTLGVLVSGTALGWKRGGLAMILYGAAGLAGVPWFADHTHGYPGATFGYVIGFVACAALCGFLAERGASRSVRRSIPAMIVGELVLYAFGVSWLAISLNVGLGTALHLGFTPFVAGDAIKAGIAALLLPGAFKLATWRS